MRDFIGLDPSFTTLLKIYGLAFFHLLSLLLPLSTFFGTLMTFYRLREDGELLALFSLGFTLKDLLIPITFFFLGTLILTHLSHFYLLPYSKREKKLTLIELKKYISQKTFPAKKPVSITENIYIYVREVEAEEEFQRVLGIILFERGSGGRKVLYQAEEAKLDLKRGLLELHNGKVFSLSPQREIEVLSFGNYLIQLREETLKAEKIQFRRGEMTISELKSSIAEHRDKNPKQYSLLLSEYYHRYLYALSITPLIIHALFLSLILPLHHRVYLFLCGIAFYTFFYYGYDFILSVAEKGNLTPLYSFALFNVISLSVILLEAYLFNKRGVLLIRK